MASATVGAASSRSTVLSRCTSHTLCEVHKPVFTETMLIGTVVRDLDAGFGGTSTWIGPWDVAEFNTGNVIPSAIRHVELVRNDQDLREYGTPIEQLWRLASPDPALLPGRRDVDN